MLPSSKGVEINSIQQHHVCEEGDFLLMPVWGTEEEEKRFLPHWRGLVMIFLMVFVYCSSHSTAGPQSLRLHPANPAPTSTLWAWQKQL